MKLSAPGWALASMAVITIITQLITIYDPSGFMRDFQVDSKPASQLIGTFPGYCFPWSHPLRLPLGW